MYESDEWYVQFDPSSQKKLHAKLGQYPTLADTEDHWDVHSLVSEDENKGQQQDQ